MPVNIVIIYNRAAIDSDKYLLSSRCNIQFINIFVCINYRRLILLSFYSSRRIYYKTYQCVYISLSFTQKYHTYCALSAAQSLDITFNLSFSLNQITFICSTSHIYCRRMRYSNNVCKYTASMGAHKLSFIFPIIQFNYAYKICTYGVGTTHYTNIYLVLYHTTICTLSTFYNI